MLLWDWLVLLTRAGLARLVLDHLLYLVLHLLYRVLLLLEALGVGGILGRLRIIPHPSAFATNASATVTTS